MSKNMRILVTNDDGYNYKGIRSLVKLLRPWGELTVVAPKYHQSGTSMGVNLGYRPVAAKMIGHSPSERWYYLDGTPASCVKYAFDEVYGIDELPDLVVSGINHGANAGAAALYSGTLGATQEAALAGVPAVGVSLDNLSRDADFSVVEELFPDILKTLMDNMSDKFGVYYNVNFPDIPVGQIKGVKLARQGIQHWYKEFRPYDYDIFDKLGIKPQEMGIAGFPAVEPGEEVFVMAGDLIGDARNDGSCDNILLSEGYITITVHTIDTTDYAELERLRMSGNFE